jgi:hypothetical protein
VHDSVFSSISDIHRTKNSPKQVCSPGLSMMWLPVAPASQNSILGIYTLQVRLDTQAFDESRGTDETSHASPAVSSLPSALLTEARIRPGYGFPGKALHYFMVTAGIVTP